MLEVGARATRIEFFRAYLQWCDDEGVDARQRLTVVALGRRLEARWPNQKVGGIRSYRGIGLGRPPTFPPGVANDLFGTLSGSGDQIPVITPETSSPRELVNGICVPNVPSNPFSS